MTYRRTCVKRPLSERPKIVFQDQLLLNAGLKYCRMHSAILLTFIKLPIVIKMFVLSIFEWPLRETKIGFQDQLLLNAGQKYCRMLHLEHSAILSTFIKLPMVIKMFVLSIFEWLFYTGFTVCIKLILM